MSAIQVLKLQVSITSPGFIYQLFIKYQIYARYTSCGGLNKNGPHRPIGIGTSRKCGLVGVGVALLEELCHREWALRF